MTITVVHNILLLNAHSTILLYVSVNVVQDKWHPKTFSGPRDAESMIKWGESVLPVYVCRNQSVLHMWFVCCLSCILYVFVPYGYLSGFMFRVFAKPLCWCAHLCIVYKRSSSWLVILLFSYCDPNSEEDEHSHDDQAASLGRGEVL